MKCRTLAALPLFLPIGAVAILGYAFLYLEVPRLENTQNRVVNAEYRAVAADAIFGNRKVEWRGARNFDWRPHGSIVAKNGAKILWGAEEKNGKMFIWFGSGKNIRAVTTEKIVVDDIASGVKIGIVAIVCLLLAATLYPVGYFLRLVSSREDFLAAAAHDLTTPLVAARRFIGKNDAVVFKLNERMLRIVDNIKTFLRPDGKMLTINVEPIDIKEVYDEAYELFKEDFKDLLGEEGIKVAGGENLRVMADRTALSQIIWNLLGNDLKYAAPYGSVRVEFAEDAKSVRMALIDEGPGMGFVQRKMAFNRYYRARTVMQSGKGGFGIGLCNAREFAKMMGGSLSVAANKPHGCVFTLKLPKPKMENDNADRG